METEFQNAFGKSVGEVARDIADFLSTPCIINEKRGIDLCRLTERLNMHEQLSFALLAEADAQGWSPDSAESFYRRAVSGVIAPSVIEAMTAAFRDRDGEAYAAYERLYGNRLSALDGSYWSTALALAIDADRVKELMAYLRTFTVTLMEFAYMEDKNPSVTYTWCYYDAFCGMLEELTAPAPTAPLPLKVRAMGGTVAKQDGDAYLLSLGVDVENPNPGRMARDVQIDVTLKDKNGDVITVIGDRLQSLDPGAIYHYGITKRVRGAAVASFSASAHAAAHLRLDLPIMKHVSLRDPHLIRLENGMRLDATVSSEYDCPLRALTVHYQLLSRENRILGGGSHWLSEGIEPNGSTPVSCHSDVLPQGVAKVLCSFDFDALELIAD